MPFYNLIVLLILMQSLTLYEFNPGASTDNWVVVNDGVMGGRSKGSLILNEEGHGVFSGEISLENYGGFSSIRHRTHRIAVNDFSTVELKVKGDGKRYQFRIREGQADYYSYIQYFETSGEWQTIVIPLDSFYPVFRGRKLNLPNFRGKSLEEIGFLIGNKRRETFRLEIDYIRLGSD
jgi:hypothetical protein